MPEYNKNNTVLEYRFTEPITLPLEKECLRRYARRARVSLHSERAASRLRRDLCLDDSYITNLVMLALKEKASHFFCDDYRIMAKNIKDDTLTFTCASRKLEARLMVTAVSPQRFLPIGFSPEITHGTIDCRMQYYDLADYTGNALKPVLTAYFTGKPFTFKEDSKLVNTAYRNTHLRVFNPSVQRIKNLRRKLEALETKELIRIIKDCETDCTLASLNLDDPNARAHAKKLGKQLDRDFPDSDDPEELKEAIRKRQRWEGRIIRGRIESLPNPNLKDYFRL